MERTILVYEKDRDVVKFLKSFFEERKHYSVHFVKKSGQSLEKEIVLKKPDVLIVSSPDGLGELQPSEIPCPIIAIISKDETKGIHSAIKSDVECYLIRPFFKEELDHKLKTLIDKSSLIESLYRDRKDLEALLELTNLASSTLNPKEVLYLIVKKISEILKVTRCSMISINAEDERYAQVLSTFEDPSLTNIRLDLKKYPEIRNALSRRKPVIIKDAQKDPLMKEVKEIIAPLGIRSIIVIPIFFREEVIGTMLLRTSRAHHAFTKREIQLCVALANASSHALYNAFLFQKLYREKAKLEKLAITDYLTGIYNIRYFYSRLEEEFSRAERYQLPLSCIMLDIDHFKKINDSYGHRIGDFILREFAQVVKRYTRKSDLLARYGGEEFIVLLPQTSLKGALIEARRLQKVVREIRFRQLREGQGITVSFGISAFPDKEIKNPDDLINSADNALYQAKEKGRDLIVSHASL
ncbi:MAG: response receiver sensor diguanylate cyclase [Nitrospirae bacterium]|nr:response receiver sensor diguanylate cyclase [Nitrospirota bacterium]